MQVLVTGINGQIGRQVADQLVAADVSVRGASGHPDATDHRAYPISTVDLSRPETLRPALESVDRVFLYGQPSAIDGQIDEFRRARVDRIVLLSSHSTQLTTAPKLSASLRTVEAALVDSGLPVTVLRPGVFASNALGWSASITRRGGVALPYPEAQVNPIHETDIADAAVALLTDIDHPAAAYQLSGPQSFTLREQLAILAEGLGRPVECFQVGVEEWSRQMVAFMPDRLIESMIDIWTSSIDVPQDTAHTLREITGQPARTFARWVADHAADFR